MFLPRVPLRKPRTEWACQVVALINSFKVAPFGRCSSVRIAAFLVPGRTAGCAAALFFAAVCFFAAVAGLAWASAGAAVVGSIGSFFMFFSPRPRWSAHIHGSVAGDSQALSFQRRSRRERPLFRRLARYIHEHEE